MEGVGPELACFLDPTVTTLTFSQEAALTNMVARVATCDYLTLKLNNI